MDMENAPDAERPLVLVVDDEPAVCRMTARFLADAGFAVLEAHDGEEALALLEDAGAVAVVSDISMPGMNGLQLKARIAERWPGVGVLLISGQGGPPAGFRGHFLPKPFSSDALLRALARIYRRPVSRTG